MELHRPLLDRELSRLAEQMSPVEFEQIALVYLRLTKGSLRWCRRDAGGDCVDYMIKSLATWRDGQALHDARVLLYSALTRAADRGLISRSSFRFLITGENNNDRGWAPQKQYRCNCWAPLVITLLGALASVCAILQCFDYDYMNGSLNKMTSLILGLNDDATYNVRNDIPATFDNGGNKLIWTLVVGSLPLAVITGSLIFECCVCFFNTSRVRVQRGQRKVNRCRFWFFCLLVVIVFIPVTAMCFTNYQYIKSCEAPAGDVVEILEGLMSRVKGQRIWDKLQIWFDCCGIYSYQYWNQVNTGVIPDSCCKSYEPNCGQTPTLDQINQNGCLHPLQGYLSDQLRFQGINHQQFYLVSGFVMLILSILIIHFARVKYLGEVEFCRVRDDFGGVNYDDAAIVVTVPQVQGTFDRINDDFYEGEVSGINVGTNGGGGRVGGAVGGGVCGSGKVGGVVEGGRVDGGVGGGVAVGGLGGGAVGGGVGGAVGVAGGVGGVGDGVGGGGSAVDSGLGGEMGGGGVGGGPGGDGVGGGVGGGGAEGDEGPMGDGGAVGAGDEATNGAYDDYSVNGENNDKEMLIPKDKSNIV